MTAYPKIKEWGTYYILLSDHLADAVRTLVFFDMFCFRGSYVHTFAMEPLVTFVTTNPKGIGMIRSITRSTKVSNFIILLFVFSRLPSPCLEQTKRAPSLEKVARSLQQVR